MERPRFFTSRSGIVLPNYKAITRYESLKIQGEPEAARIPSRGEIEYRVTLGSGEQWRVHLDQMSPVDTETLDRPNVNKLQRQLQRRVVSASLEDSQREALYFLHANWKDFVDFFYEGEHEHDIEPKAFAEVLIGKHPFQRIDFVGFGPDGKIFLIRANARSNNSQELERQQHLFLNKFGLAQGEVVTRMAFYREDTRDASSGLFRIVTRQYNSASMEEL